ncbi:U-box domain-containing protein 33-like [Panicum miliaceum]|uniref:RING-type E3 ubiquitin transferase n=1 Tax=Panicum miliaceum TaxID=4540 RepID=A0A3L6PVL7_PANMI|nr:U-box domain-containing protein 33-like [Panicum miliaceum]
MEILGPSPLPSPCPRLRCGGRRRGQHRGEAWVHVAVGRSPEKTLGLLRWALRRFGKCRIVLLHVHQPSPLIPTLLGKIPAAQATEELVLSHRKSEKEETDRVLLAYLAFCRRAQVQAKLLLTENDQIHDGILDLVNQYRIDNLVMGSTRDSCFKLKYGKESLMASNAPAFCQIWFVWRGRHIWTREASAATDNIAPVHYQDDVMAAERIRFSSYSNNAGTILDEGHVTGEALMTADLSPGIISDYDGYEALGEHEANHFYSMNIANWQDAESAALNSTFCSDSSVHMDTLPSHSKVMMVADGSRKKAFVELLKRKETESKVASAFARAKDSDSAKKHEIKMRGELEALLVATRKQHEDLLKNKERAVAALESSMKRLAILDARAAKIKLQMDEFSAELEVIQSSIESLRQKKLKLPKLEDRHTGQVRGFTYSHATLSNCMSNAFGDDLYSFEEFTLLDMQSATCKFSESFKIRSHSHGCVYKGEIMNRTVMIYKLHSHSIESVKQFQQEVYILSKVRHPHLLTLVGACPETLCLVYEYPPSESLHDRLFSRCNSHWLPWKIRARIVAEISGALLFLHSCKPQMIIHGNLKLENILLDTECHCKIADFGISRLFTDDMKDCPSFAGGSELKESFPHADTEYKRSKIMASKSDIYYFGMVILQLLTGKQELVGLAGEVRRAMSCGKLSSILDPTAGQWPLEVAGKLAELGLRYSETSSQDRLELTLETEMMHDPQVCADGLTYEGRAIREWMDSGREMSPLTSLKLEHRNLTPNHALRFAIKDWLRHSHSPMKL